MKYLVASQLQQAYWYRWIENPAKNTDYLPYLFSFSSDLNITAVECALACYVNQYNELCRSHFIEGESGAEQVIAPHLEFKVNYLDLAEVKEEERSLAEKEYIDYHLHGHFNLEKGPLFRFALLKKANKEYYLTASFHRAVFSEKDYPLFIEQFSSLYNHYAFGNKLSIKSPVSHIEDYLSYELQQIKKNYSKDLNYWKRYLSGKDLKTLLPYQRQLRVEDGTLDAINFLLDEELSAKLKEVAEKHKQNLFSVVAFLYGILLSRYCAQKEIIMAYSVSMLPEEFFALGGSFLNYIPLLFHLKDNESFNNLFVEFCKGFSEGRMHKSCPEWKIRRVLKNNEKERRINIKISETTPPIKETIELFNVLQVKQYAMNPEEIDVDFHLYFSFETVLSLQISYNAALFNKSTVEQFSKHFKRLAELFVKDEGAIPADIDYLSKHERSQLLEKWNDTVSDFPEKLTINQLFEAQVLRTPENIAAVFEGKSLTYASLNFRANKLAGLIRSHYQKYCNKSLKPNALIGLCVNRSLDMIVAILAIMKAGAAYVPLDPDYPEDRLQYMIDDSHEALIITQKNIVDNSEFLNRLHRDELLFIDDDNVIELLASSNECNLDIQVKPDDLAYVIYTSGSTGRPKGTMLAHKGVVNRISWMHKRYSLTEKDRVLQKTPFSFDVSVWELLWPVLFGGQLFFAKPGGHKEPDYLLDAIDRFKITKMHFVPSMLQVFMDYVEAMEGSSKKLSSLKDVFCSGEALPYVLAKQFLEKNPAIKLHNLYGPTEASIDVTYFDCSTLLSGEGSDVLIGKPIDNTQLYVLDANLNLCPAGTQGELYIGGVGLAKGYLNQEELTKQRFILNPFSKELGLPGSDRIYKTGDLVRWTHEGEIEYLGRTDFQIKIRGFRIELGEIESVLSKHENISQACVITKTNEDNEASSMQLVAYCVVNESAEPAKADLKAVEKTGESHVDNWQMLYDEIYNEDKLDSITFDITGWNSSFTGDPVPADEMREWVDATVKRVCSYKPKTILEIGCGSGLLLYPLVQKCEKYYGLDVSRVVVERLENSFENLNINNAHVAHAYAHQLDKLSLMAGNESADLIIINSVIQYFPNLAYLDDVLDQAINFCESGEIIIGDVRDYRLIYTFFLSIFCYQATQSGEEINWSQALKILDYKVRRERELLIDPRYFLNLKDQYPKISKVELLPRIGKYNNEMNLFRYDAVLHIKKEAQVESIVTVNWRSWERGLNLTSLIGADSVLGVRAYPNKRVWLNSEIAYSLLELKNIEDELEYFQKEESSLLSIEELSALAEEKGYQLYIHLNLSHENSGAYYDLVFYKDSSISPLSFNLSSSLGRSTDFSNEPLVALSLEKYNFSDVKKYLHKVLPDYMVPSLFIKLEQMPLTANGKVNRKLLPEPDKNSLSEDYVAPKDEVEMQMCEIWQSLLGVTQVGVNDDFFRLGGNSILAIQFINRAKKELGVAYGIVDLFHNKTIANLMRHGGAVTQASQSHAEIDTKSLNHFEKLILAHQFSTENQLIYNENLLMTLDKKIDMGHFLVAATYVVNKYEVLGSNYLQDGDDFVRVPSGAQELVCESIDLNSEDELKPLLSRLVKLPFDLKNEKLIRFYLINLPNKQCVDIVHHHAVLDGSSLVNIISAAFYQKLINLEYDFEEKPQKLETFAKLSNKVIDGYEKNKQKKLEYWRGKLSDCEPITLGNKSSSELDYAGAQVSFVLNKETSLMLRRVAGDLKSSLFNVLYSIFSLLLAKASSGRKIAIRINVDERIYAPEYSDFAGCFINNIFLVSQLQRDLSLADYIKLGAVELMQSINNAVKFSDIVELDRDLAKSLSEVHFNLETEETQSFPYDQSFILSHSGQVKNGLYLELDAKSDKIYARVEYIKAKYSSQTIQSLIESYQCLINSLPDNLDKSLGEISIVGESQLNQILFDWTSAKLKKFPNKTIVQLFEEQVRKTPHDTAVYFDEHALSYQALNASANQLARYIRARYQQHKACELKPDQLIGLCVERSFAMIISILAIMKAGAAYVPLDPDYPEERLEYMIEDSHDGLIISQKKIVEKKQFLRKLHDDEILVVDEQLVVEELAKQSKDNLNQKIHTNQLAYVIYTSGSTGKPKGTMLQHAGVVNRIHWMHEQYGLQPNERILQKTPFSFDVSVWELLWPVLYGGTLVFAQADGHKDPEYLLNLIDSAFINKLHFVPSMLQVFLEYIELNKISHEKLSSIKDVFCSGEALPIKLAKKISSTFDFNLHNLYGPTEASIDVSYYDCKMLASTAYETVPIGKAIDNTQLYILDADLGVCPIGIPGELYIGGVGLARAYLHRIDLTQERFIQNPLAQKLGLPKDDRIYKTGDLVRWGEDGNIEYIGRTDFQVKVRGFRIELGEIERVLLKYNGITQACVLLKDDTAQKVLLAYYSSETDVSAPGVDELRAFLSEQLPEYMIPAAFVYLDVMPLTANGKINRKELPDPEVSVQANFIAPESEAEKKIAEVWQEVLRLEKVSINDNFFSIGGDSILGIRIVSRLKALGFKVSVSDLFAYLTIAKLAENISVDEVLGEASFVKPFDLMSKDDRRKVPEGVMDAYPVSAIQAGMLFHNQLDSKSTEYLQVDRYIFEADYNESFISKVWELLVDSHALLRTAFDFTNYSIPIQLVYKKIILPIEFIDISQLSGSEQSVVVSKWFAKAEKTVFDITSAPIFRLVVHRLGPAKFSVGFPHHHAILDGWSVAALFTKFMKAYEAALHGDKLPNFRLAIDYKDYVLMEKEALHSKREQEFWLSEITGVESMTWPQLLGKQASSPGNQSKQVELSSVQESALRALATKFNVSLDAVMLAIHFRVLSFVTGRKDVVTGVVHNGRPEHESSDQVLGLFLNTLPFRVLVDASSWEEFCAKIFEHKKQIFSHRYYPLSEIQHLANNDNLFDMFFNFMNFHAYNDADGIVNDIKMLDVESPFDFNTETNFSFGFHCDLSYGPLKLLINYESSVYPLEQINFIAKAYERMVACALEELSFENTYAQVFQEECAEIENVWNNTEEAYDRDKTLFQLFDEQLLETPDNIAVIDSLGKYTYQQIDQSYRAIARFICSKGGNKKALIAVLSEKSMLQVVATMGIMRSGCAYLPLHVEWPIGRIDDVLHEGQVSTVLVSQTQYDSLVEGSVLEKKYHWHVVEELISKKQVNDNYNYPVVNSEDVAYVIFTSGSTGKPKGVTIAHKGAVNTIVSVNQRFSINASDRVLALSELSFDLSVYDIFGLLAVGGAIIFPDQDKTKNPNYWYELIEEHCITVWDTVPQFVQLLVDHVQQEKKSLEGLRVILMSGDWIPLKLPTQIQALAPNATVMSLGGATEGSIWSIWYEFKKLDPSWVSIPYGKAMPNQAMYVLNEYGFHCPVGATGEIYIGGEGVALGYWQDEEKTAASFISHPKLGRLYKTGDLGRWMASGNIEYIGRTDLQVKIRGFRVEIGEIESALSAHPAIAQACVLAYEQDGQKYLVAYYVLLPKTFEPKIEDLSSYLAKDLPEYMVPSFFIKLDEILLTANGKVDRKSLPAPDIKSLNKEYVAPKTETEKVLAAIWCDVLKLRIVGAYDNFLYLGGSSLQAIQLASRIQAKLNQEVPIKALFDYPQLNLLAAYLDGLSSHKLEVLESIPSVSRGVGDASFELSFSQQRLWFLDQYEGSNENYNIKLILSLKGPLDVDVLEYSINQLIARQDSFRTIFIKDNNGVGRQLILPKLKLTLSSEDCDKDMLNKKIHKEAHTPFNLEEGPLVRVHLYRLKEEEFVLFFNHHHIISDGTSVDIILKELSELYKAELQGRQPKLEPLKTQYVDYAAWQKKLFSAPEFQEKLDYWRRHLADHTDLQLPLDKSRPVKFSYRGVQQHFSLPLDLSKALSELAKEQGVTMYSLFLTAFNILLSRYSDQKTVIVGTPVANRLHPDVDELVGFFVNTLVMKNTVDVDATFEELLTGVMKNSLQAFEHQEIPFEQVVENLEVDRDTSKNPIFQVMFAYQTFGTDKHGQSILSLPGVEAEVFNDVQYEVSLFDLSLFIEESSDGLIGTFEYCTDLFFSETINRFTKHLENLLHAIVQDPSQKVADLEWLSQKEKQTILFDWNQTQADYPSDLSTSQLFEFQVSKTPNQRAITFDKDSLTYQELNERANQLAHYISAEYQHGLVGLCCERSLDMITAILAILKVGAAYVPLDPDYPDNRIEYMINDSQLSLILTQEKICKKLSGFKYNKKVKTLVIDSARLQKSLLKQPVENLPTLAGPKDLVYVIYTSGSTGKPKGVLQEHGGCVNRICWMQDFYKLKLGETYMHKTPIGFDVSFGEIFWPLTMGAQLIIAKPKAQGDLGYLCDLISQQKIENIHFVPALLTVFCDYVKENYLVEKVSSLKRVFCSGEALKLEHKKKLLALLDVELHNIYGPTESGEISAYDCSEKDGASGVLLSIGKPISNTQFYILDAGLNPCPVGVPGELYIGGIGLARGYLNQEELTDKKFIKNKYSQLLGLPASDRIYATGDVVRWLADGNIEYVGRVDFQLKIRGFRIELDEISSVLADYEGISQASVIPFVQSGQTYLAAYYTTDNKSLSFSGDDLRDYLLKYLPDHSVPRVFTKLNEMPITANGKLDRKALPVPDLSIGGEKYVPPSNQAESEIQEIWQEILKQQKISIIDDFFHVGGHSILTIQLVSKLNQKYGLKLSVSWVFEHVTIQSQAKAIAAGEKVLSAYQPILTLNASDADPPIFFIHPARAGAEAYRDVPALIAGKRNAFALESFNMNHLDKPICDLVALAKRYKTYIKHCQPKGPYFLCGWSLGGTTAFELARQLKGEGDTVSAVYLIDSVGQPKEMWRKWQDWYEKNVPDHFIEILKSKNLDDDTIDKLLKLKPIEEKLLANYDLKPLEGVPIILMSALEPVFSDNKRIADFYKHTHEMLKAENKGWGRYTKNLTVHDFHASHDSIMTGEHLRRLISIILDDVQNKLA